MFGIDVVTVILLHSLVPQLPLQRLRNDQISLKLEICSLLPFPFARGVDVRVLCVGLNAVSIYTYFRACRKACSTSPLCSTVKNCSQLVCLLQRRCPIIERKPPPP